MRRRNFLTIAGGVSMASLAGCTSGSDAPHGTSDDNTDIDYDVDTENFTINALFVSRNAPDQLGISVRVVSDQFGGVTLPVELWLLNENGDVVFHEPVFAMELDGGAAALGTRWFTVSEEEFHTKYYPKARIRTESTN